MRGVFESLIERTFKFVGPVIVLVCSFGAASNPSRKLIIVHFLLGIRLQEILVLIEALAGLRQHGREIHHNEFSQARIRRIPCANIVIPKEVLVPRLSREFLLGFGQQLVIGLMENNAALRQKLKCYERNSTSNKNGNTVKSNAFKKKVVNFLTVGVKPLANVFCLDSSPSSGSMTHKKIQFFFARKVSATE